MAFVPLPQLQDPSQNFMEAHPRALDAFFQPRHIAVIGAKDERGSVGRTLLTNLLAGDFPGVIYPINPKRSEVLGLRCYPTLADLPEAVDLALIATPAATVAPLIRECGTCGTRAAIVISAGFKELGPQGLALEGEIVAASHQHGVRVIGPNCLGVMNPLYRLNATFARGMARPGSIAFISQSGAMCTAVLDWSVEARVGFSAFVSIGSMADVDWGDLISYLGAQPTTRSILLYMETIGNARSFLSAAREISLEKPIIAIKPGRTAQAAHAAASHTGSLTGSDEVLEAAFERVGVLRVDTIGKLFSMASIVAHQPLPKGPKLTIITNAGGPAVMATDAAVLSGVEISELRETTLKALNGVLPSAWSHGNPVDLLGDALPERYGQALEILKEDEGTDGVLAILSPQDITDPATTAEYLAHHMRQSDKPILASWMGGNSVHKGIEILKQANIPNFEYPDDAAWTFAAMWRYHQNLKSLYEVPRALSTSSPQRERAHQLIAKAQKEGRSLLTESESKELLICYAIPCVQTTIATEAESALSEAERIGYPVVLKLFSHTITHKSDVGGVHLNLIDADAVIKAFSAIEKSVSLRVGREHFQGVTVQPMISRDEGYELILGSSTDPQFGPVLLFGTGGQLVEVYRDRALALPPLNSNLAYHLIAKTKIFQALQGIRGRGSVNKERLEQLLVSFSQLITENNAIRECDINPLFASEQHLIALDARIVLHPTNTVPPPLAIRPYPIAYRTQQELRDGTAITVRPISPEDEPAIVAFHHELSEMSVRLRYLSFLSLDERTTHERLLRICFNDYDRELALIAEMTSQAFPQIAGVARLSRQEEPTKAALTMIIADAFHNKGLGTLLLKQLIFCARAEGITQLSALILSENSGMIRLCHKFAFCQQAHPDPLMTYLVLSLDS